MSLTKKQEDDTRRELKENFEKAGVTIRQVADDLGTTDNYIETIFRLDNSCHDDTWILKNYLIEKVIEAGKTPTPFTALGGDYHDIWFLNSRYIDGKKIRR